MKLDGQSLVLVDTPGFGDTVRRHADVFKQLAIWLREMFEAGYRLSGLLYLHPITQTRMTKSEIQSLRVFTELIGHASPKIVLVTTQWDLENTSLAISREAELKTHFWRPAPWIEQGRIVARFNGDHDSAIAVLKTCVLNQHFREEGIEYFEELMDLEERFYWITDQLKEKQESLFASPRAMEQIMKGWQDMKKRFASTFSIPKIVNVSRVYAKFYQTIHNTISSWTRPKLRAGYRRISWTCVSQP